MGSPSIKSGTEVVREFLDALQNNTALDRNVVATIQEQQGQGRMTKIRLLQALADQRGKKVRLW